MAESKISKRQVFVFLSVCRVTALFDNTFAHADAAQVTLCTIVLLVACTLIRRRFSAAFQKEISISFAEPPYYTVILFGVVFLSTLLHYHRFLNATFSESVYQSPLLILFTLAVVIYAIKKGVEGFSRFALLVAVLVCVMITVVVLGNLRHFEVSHLSALKPNLLQFARIFIDLTFFSELISLGVLSPFVREPIKRKDVILFIEAQAVVIAALCVLKEAVLGKAAQLVRFPIATLLITGEWSAARRLDTIGLCLISLAFIVKMIDITEVIFSALRRRYGKSQDKKTFSFLISGMFLLALAVLVLPQTQAEGFEAIKRLFITIYLIFSGVKAWKSCKNA